MTSTQNGADSQRAAARGARVPFPIRAARWVRRATLPFAIVALLWFFFCYGAMKVPTGMDTMPTIPPGSFCLVDKRGAVAKKGHEVFVEVPDGGTLLSRVKEITDDDRLVLQNDRVESRLPDSRAFGPLSRDRVRGVVLMVYPSEGLPFEEIRGR